jgi:hypothetical protein
LLESVWTDLLSLKVIKNDVDSSAPFLTQSDFLSPVMAQCLLEYFKQQVNASFTTQCNAGDTSAAVTVSCDTPFDLLACPTSTDCNWFAILEEAAVKTLPLLLVMQSLHACLKRRNALFLSCVTPSSDEQARQEAKKSCEQVVCVQTRVFAMDKVSLLLKVRKKQKSTLQTDALLSQSSHGTHRAAPLTETRDVQLDIQLDVAVEVCKPLKVVKLGSTVFCLEHVSIANVKNSTVVQSELDHFVSGLFQQR